MAKWENQILGAVGLIDRTSARRAPVSRHECKVVRKRSSRS
jgi:hypothetical protein